MEIHEAGTEVLENKGFLCVFFCLETVAMPISALWIIPGRRWPEHVET